LLELVKILRSDLLTIVDDSKQGLLLGEAFRVSREVLRLRPELEYIRVDLAQTFYDHIARRRKVPDGIDNWITSAKESIRLKRDSADDSMDLARAFHFKNRYADAISSYREAVLLRPDIAELWYELGLTLMTMFNEPTVDGGEAEEAVACMREAIARKPVLAGKGFDGAYLLIKRGDFEGSARFSLDAIRTGLGKSSDNYGILANALREKGDLEHAEGVYHEVLRRNPLDDDCIYNLGLLHLRQGRMLEVLDEWTQSRALDDEDSGWWWMGRASFEDVQIALGEMGSVPRSAVEQLVVAKGCYDGMECARAAELFRNAYRLDPGILRGNPPFVRRDAAVAAAQAGCGLGHDAARLDDAERTAWRRQALEWLRDDLGYARELLRSGDAAARGRLRRPLWLILREWRLRCVRDSTELAKLPAAEREAWQAFWTDLLKTCAAM
jgi:tetratricopeptide (TPR) repeat protein